jgi:hypothetical protein
MVAHCLPFGGSKCCPKWLLQVPAAQPVVAILTIWARVLVEDHDSVPADQLPQSRKDRELSRVSEVMQRQSYPDDVDRSLDIV